MVLIAMLLFLAQEDIVSEELETTTYSDRFTEAVQKYNSVERSESQPIFEEIVAALEASTRLSEEEKLIMAESLKYLGVINYPGKTDDYFERLLRLDPGYQLNARDLPPKIVAVLENLRQQLVGGIRIQTSDGGDGSLLEGALLIVDGKPLGPVAGESSFSLLAGKRTLAIERVNYDTYNAEVEVVAGQTLQFNAALTRNAAELVLVTIPAEVQVTVNGDVVGQSQSPAPGTYRAKLSEMGLDLKDAGVIVVNGLKPGSYTIEYSKPCFKTWRGSRDVNDAKRWFFSPEKLEPSEAFLSVDTPGEATGIAFLDQDRLGYLPIENHRICPGTYTLRVQFSDGEFVKRLSVEEGNQLSISAEPLPSIAWFGVQDDGEGGGAPPEANAWLTGLSSWNVLPIDPNNTAVVPVNPFPILFGGREMTADGRAALTRQLKADLYMAARVVRKKVVIRYLELAFWTPLSKSISVYSYDFREMEKLKNQLAQIDTFPPLNQAWLGVQTAKLRGIDGCKVIEVHASGPLAGKLNVGDVIQTLNGNPLRNPGDLIALTAGQNASLGVGDGQVDVAPVPAIAEVAYDPQSFVPQALLAKFEKFSKYHKDTLVRQSAAFNQARYQFFLGDFRQAFDIFSTLNLSDGFGINQGTLFYYQGLCFRRLKLSSEATSAFKQVLAYPNATLFDAYGPKAAFWAEAELKTAAP